MGIFNKKKQFENQENEDINYLITQGLVSSIAYIVGPIVDYDDLSTCEDEYNKVLELLTFCESWTSKYITDIEDLYNAIKSSPNSLDFNNLIIYICDKLSHADEERKISIVMSLTFSLFSNSCEYVIDFKIRFISLIVTNIGLDPSNVVDSIFTYFHEILRDD